MDTFPTDADTSAGRHVERLGEEHPMHDACAGCAEPAPKVRTAGTLADMGWRMVTTRRPDQSMAVDWLCPECWRSRTGWMPLKTPRPPP